MNRDSKNEMMRSSYKYIYGQLANRCQGRPEGSLFNSYNIEV